MKQANFSDPVSLSSQSQAFRNIRGTRYFPPLSLAKEANPEYLFLLFLLLRFFFFTSSYLFRLPVSKQTKLSFSQRCHILQTYFQHSAPPNRCASRGKDQPQQHSADHCKEGAYHYSRKEGVNRKLPQVFFGLQFYFLCLCL